MVFTLRFIEAGCQLLAAGRLTLVYLASSYRVHMYSHQESFKVVWSIAMAINYCYWRVDGSKNWWRCVNTVEEVPTLVFFSSSKWSVRGRGLDKLFKSMLTCDLRGQVAGYQLSPFDYLSTSVCACLLLRLCCRVRACVRSLCTVVRVRRIFWPTYCSRRSTPKKSVLISCLSGQPVCCRKQGDKADQQTSLKPKKQ